MTVMTELPTGVEAVVETVRTEVQVALQDVGLKDAVAPDGSPKAERVTDCVLPARRVAVMVFVT